MTPYDTALRLYRRQVDEIKVSIGIEMERLAALTARTRAHEATWRQERALARALPFASDAWAARMRDERARIDAAQTSAQTQLDRLRREVAKVYGTLRAIETAAQRCRDDAERAMAAAEQAGIDDVSASRLARSGAAGRAA